VTTEPRVLLLAETYHPILGGGEKHTRSLAIGLASRGFAVDVITRRSNDELAAREVDGGVTIHRVGPTGTGRGKKFAMVPDALRLARELTRDADVVMNGGTRVLALPARIAVRGTPCGLVLRPELNGELDGTLALWGRDSGSVERRIANGLARFRNLFLQRTDAVVAISQAIAREAAASGFAPEKVHVIPHGIDMDEYAPVPAERKLELRRSLGLPVDRVIATYTGRLIQGKGLETLFEAMRSLRELTDLHLVLVGSGSGQVISIEDSLRVAAGAAEFVGRVTFTGRVDNVPAYLQASDIFVFPTLDEALGMSAVEAQACGLPAVASRTGGVPDIIEDGVTGILTPPGDASALAAGLRALVTDAGRRDVFGAAARDRSKAGFALDVCVSRYADLFRSIVSRRRAA
jgi:glycosyltransferase involved in cell wall biosynthesis